MVRLLLNRVVPSAVILMAAACTNDGADLGFGPLPSYTVSIGVYLDRDGSKSLTALDTVYQGARVALFIRGSTDTFRIGNTDVTGLLRFNNVPLGQYQVAMVQRSIGDSLEIQKIENDSLRIEITDSVTGVLARVGYPEVTIQQVRALPAGKRVFLRGIVLSGVQSFRDTTSHVSDNTGRLRLTGVSLRGGLTGNVPGDSVSVLGVTSSRAGQPVLDLSVISRLGTRPAPIAIPVGTGIAATAQNGVLDAGLVVITGAIISDTVTVAPDFKVTVSDGTGSLEMILDGNLPFPRSLFFPGRRMSQAFGVLVPNGVGGWYFKPRQLGDVVLN